MCKHELALHQSQKAMSRFEKLLGSVSPPAQWREEAIAFAREIFGREIEKAEELMDNGRFLDALNMLNQTEKSCQVLQQWECPVILGEKLTEAHYGMYQSYLSVAKRAYTNASYSFATTYARSAWEYQQNNAGYIASPEEVIKLLQLIADGYFEQINEAFELNDFTLALKLSGEVAALCETYSNKGVYCREDANNLTRKAEAAKKRSERIILPVVLSEPAVDRDEMTREQTLEEVKQLLSEGHLKAWAGETHQARDYLKRIMQYAIRYELRKDTIINQRILNLTEMITAKECELTHRELQTLLSQTDDFFKRGYYQEAEQNYQQALRLHEAAGNCPWNLSDTLETWAFLEKVGGYNKLFHEAQSAYFRAGQRGFKEFIDKYQVAGEYYLTHRLQEYGVEHQSLFEFSAGSSNSALMKTVIQFLSEKGYHPEVIELLKLLNQQGFAARELRTLQEFAGSKMASHLYKLNPHLNTSEFIRDKTNNDPWFRNFVRSFNKNWP